MRTTIANRQQPSQLPLAESDSDDLLFQSSEDEKLTEIQPRVRRPQPSDLTTSFLLGMVLKECKMAVGLAKADKTKKRKFVRSFRQSINFFLGIIPRMTAVYIISLGEVAVDPRHLMIQHIQRICPAISVLFSASMLIDGSIFRDFRALVGMLFLLFGSIGLSVLGLQIGSGGGNFTGAAVFSNHMYDLMIGLTLLVFKSKWPFKPKKRE